MEGDTTGLTIDPAPSGRNGKMTFTARLNGEPIHVDELNVKSDKARAAFIAKVCKGRPGIDTTALESELLRLAADEASRVVKPLEENAADSATPEAAELLAKMPEGIRAEAQAMLQSTNLVKSVVDDIGQLGVAGERQLAATVYLVGVSRLLPQPLAAIVQGPTSSGKSYVIRKAASLFPPEAIILATQLTPQALFYMKPGSLVHRFVVVGERSRAENDENADATRALREMLSEGRLSKLLPMKVDGRQETVLIEQDGPIAYIESTTLSKLFNEDANRCILLATDGGKV
jgi:hypothetical protein